MDTGGFGGKKAGGPPPGVVCHICGRSYGSSSIQIHIKACEKK